MSGRTVCWIAGIASALLLGCVIGCSRTAQTPPAKKPALQPAPIEAPKASAAAMPGAREKPRQFRVWVNQIAESQIRAREAARAARVALWIGGRAAAAAETGFGSLAYLRNLAAQFAGDLREIRSGIADATAAGDVAIAAEVQQAGLKLLRARAAMELVKIWQGLKWCTATAWDRMGYAIESAIIEINAAEEIAEIRARENGKMGPQSLDGE